LGTFSGYTTNFAGISFGKQLEEEKDKAIWRQRNYKSFDA